MKSTILLASTLFLISAPAPDSGDIAEMTSNLIVPEQVPGLLASEEATKKARTETAFGNAGEVTDIQNPDGTKRAQTVTSEKPVQPARD